MSVEYEAVFGVGYVVSGDEDELDALFANHDLYRFDVSGNYFTGSDLKKYVFIDSGLPDIAKNIDTYRVNLKGFLDRNGVIIVSDFGLHGDYRVW